MLFRERPTQRQWAERDVDRREIIAAKSGAFGFAERSGVMVATPLGLRIGGEPEKTGIAADWTQRHSLSLR